MSGRHLVLGSLEDVLTGEILDDTLDERYRQKLAGILINDLGYEKSRIIPRSKITVEAGEKKAVLTLDFLVKPDDRFLMLIKFGPGSLITRHRSALAFSRCVAPYQIPVVVVTNGEDADILDGRSGKKIGAGINAVPDAKTLVDTYGNLQAGMISEKRMALEQRVLYAYEVDGSCSCDETVCRP